MCKDNEMQQEILWGISSHGSPKCDYVEIYTKIIDFMPWIYETFLYE